MIYWLWLKNIHGLGPVLSKTLLGKYKTPIRIYKCTEEELLLIRGIGNKLAQVILKNRCLKAAKAEFYELKKRQIHLLTYHDYRYPEHAKTYLKAPILLYYMGTLKPKTKNIAIIGNERYTNYSETVTTKAVLHLFKAKYALVSGLARGIESLAVQNFIYNGAYQIVFVPHGLDVYAPQSNRQRINQIIKNGAVLSEYPLGTKPIKPFFLRKNALVASWSHQILLVEASSTTSALRVINIAKEQSKPIFVVPHELYQEQTMGSNQILSDIGRLFLDPMQLTPDFNTETLPVLNDQINECSDELKILKVLKTSDKTIDEVAHELQIPILKIIELMTMLELESKVIQLPGIKYRII